MSGTHTHAVTPASTQARSTLTVSRPHDPAELQADRAADVVARGGSVVGWSFANQPAGSGVHREEAGEKKDPNAAEYEEAAKKTAGAVVATAPVKAIIKKVEDSPPVKAVKGFLDTKAGKATAAGVLAAGAGGLAAAGKPLPFQLPDVEVKPGISVGVTVEGPLNRPTSAGFTLTFKEQAPAGGKKGPTDAEKLAKETAGLRASVDMLTPTSVKAARKADEDAAVAAWLARESTRFKPFVPIATGSPVTVLPVPAAQPAEPKKAEEENAGPTKEGEATVARAAAAPAAATHLDPSGVAQVAGSAGRPLAPATRATMESRFGYDFSAVRLHDDSSAHAAARDVDAHAFTLGTHIGFAPGRLDPSSPDGVRLLAHELAHVVAQSPDAVHRKRAGSGTTTVAATKADHQAFVDEATRFLTAASEHYATIAAIAKVPVPVAPGQAAPAKAAPEAKAEPAKAEPAKAAVAKAASPTPGLSEARLVTTLESLKATYEGATKILDTSLSDDVARRGALEAAYVRAARAARTATVGQSRVNLSIIAAPKEDRDGFIENATTYAALYYGKGLAGEVVRTVPDVDTIDALLDAIETTEPNRMIGRIDLFAHGTIEPSHQLKLGKTWNRIEAFEAAAKARAGRSRTLATRSRFDGSTVIELHACRLGAPDSVPGTSGLAQTHGTDFLTGVGQALGGPSGQTVKGYQQRWVPRRFALGTMRDPATLTGRRRTAYERIAIETYDAVMAGSTEVTSLLTEPERAGTTPVTRARKIAIMDTLYVGGGGAWIIGHQYSGATPASTNPAVDVKGARDTFSAEKDWQSKVLTVTVPDAGATP